MMRHYNAAVLEKQPALGKPKCRLLLPISIKVCARMPHLIWNPPSDEVIFHCSLAGDARVYLFFNTLAVLAVCRPVAQSAPLDCCRLLCVRQRPDAVGAALVVAYAVPFRRFVAGVSAVCGVHRRDYRLLPPHAETDFQAACTLYTRAPHCFPVDFNLVFCRIGL